MSTNVSSSLICPFRVTVGQTFTSIPVGMKFDPDPIPAHGQRRFPVNEIWLKSGMGIVTGPARIPFFPVPVNVDVVEINQTGPESCVILCVPSFHHGVAVAVKAEGISIPGVRGVHTGGEPLDGERFLTNMDCVTVCAGPIRYGLVSD